MVLPEIYLDPWEAYDALSPLALFVVAVTLYGVFVFHFYRFLARKDIIQLNLEKHNQASQPALRKTVSVVFYIFKSLLLFPLFVAFWFLVMAGLLLMMGKNHSIDSVMLAAIGVVAAIRICAFYNGALAMDIAKILPFALLGIMLIDSSLISIPQPTDSLQQAAMRLETMIYYLIGVVALEYVLRIISGIFGLLRRAFAGEEPAEEPAGPEVGKVGKPRPDAPAPTHVRRPAYGPAPTAGMGASPVYGSAQTGVAEGAKVSLPQTGSAPGGLSYPGDIPGYLGTGLPSSKVAHDSPRSGPLTNDNGRPSS